jgi:hypothetical protein
MKSDDPPRQPPTKSPPPQSAPASDPATPPRPLTIDDVPRLGSGTGIAVGCFVVVVVAVALFWLVRGWLLHVD